jgi:hypothetical protein
VTTLIPFCDANANAGDYNSFITYFINKTTPVADLIGLLEIMNEPENQMKVGSIITNRFASAGLITPSAVATIVNKYLPPTTIGDPDTKYEITLTDPLVKGNSATAFIYKYVLNAVDNKKSWR